MITNSTSNFGWVSIALHWLMALAFFAMYALGTYMVDLDYYDSWYHQAPALHKSVGVLLAALMLFRFAWNNLQPRPVDLGADANLNRLARLFHYLFYLLVLVLLISGYLISTAKGKPIEVFELFRIAAWLPENEQRGELAGKVHEILAHVFLILALVHAGAALKHHFIEKDATLLRMLRSNPSQPGDKQ